MVEKWKTLYTTKDATMLRGTNETIHLDAKVMKPVAPSGGHSISVAVNSCASEYAFVPLE